MYSDMWPFGQPQDFTVVYNHDKSDFEVTLLEARDVLELAKNSKNVVLTSDPPIEAWKYNRVDEKIRNVISKIDNLLKE